MTSNRQAPGLELVRSRPVVVPGVEAWFSIRPGERSLVTPGEMVVRGAPLAERRRELRTEVVSGPTGPEAEPGGWWAGRQTGRSGTGRTGQGELLFHSGGHWRVASGDLGEPLAAPFSGIVGVVEPGSGVTLRTDSLTLLGSDALGGPTVGAIHVLAARDGHVRTSDIDVGGAGAILVAGETIDAEAITRARAVGVRGIIVAGLGIKERREVIASERRARSGVHDLPPFAILILEGALGRPIASPVMAVLQALEGKVAAIIPEPAGLVFDDARANRSAPRAGLVRVIAGPLAGVEGTWDGLAGRHRFAGGVTLEAGWIRLPDQAPMAIPLGDLERFA
ncbi:MAG: hypothetical protein ABI598_00240 [Chloroflexota bacterium]